MTLMKSMNYVLFLVFYVHLIIFALDVDSSCLQDYVSLRHKAIYTIAIFERFRV